MSRKMFAWICISVCLVLIPPTLGGCVYPFNQKHPLNPVCLFDCAEYVDREYEIRHRAITYTPGELGLDYCEEYKYIEERRQHYLPEEVRESGKSELLPQEAKTGEQVPGPPRGLSGIAFSGGGLRSATFNLGVAQALQEEGLFEQLDYISTVSGSSYLAGWMLAHLGQEEQDERGYAIETTEAEKLLSDSQDFVRHLRTHSGFFQTGSFWEGPGLIWDYVWRWPFYIIWDLGLHIKTFPTVENGVHLFRPYQKRIELTYLRGKQHLSMAGVQKRHLIAPYLILNGNLVNRGKSRSYPDFEWQYNYNFEFTHDFTGSDGLGYVRTPGFGRPIKEVIEQNGRPVKVFVKDPDGEPCDQSVRAQVKGDPCLHLSEAMTTSGAAFDINSVWVDISQNEVLLWVLQTLTLPLNINFKYHTWNYAREYDGFLTLYDYLRMMTWKRLGFGSFTSLTTGDRWIEITDGSFFDNLGIYALLKRGVTHIIAGDATLDTKWTYHYLQQLLQALAKYSQITEWCGDLPEENEIIWYRKFWVKRPDGSVAAIHYLKPYAYNRQDLFKDNPDLKKASSPGEPYLSDHPEPDLDLSDTAVRQRFDVEQPPHLSLEEIKKRVAQTIEDEQKIKPAIDRVTKFAKYKEANGFPHTSTLFQWYSMEEFEAYRFLGYLMGKTYLSLPRLVQSGFRKDVRVPKGTPCRTVTYKDEVFSIGEPKAE